MPSIHRRKSSIGVRFRQKSPGLYSATVELVDANIDVEHLLSKHYEENTEILDGLGTAPHVKITLKEPANLSMVKLNQKVVLECSLLLSDSN